MNKQLKYFFLTFFAVILGFSSLNAQQIVPDFKLLDVSGDTVQFSKIMGVKKAGVVIFTSNHCVYSKKYEDRIISLALNYQTRAGFVMVNSNDPELSEDDSYESMKSRATEKSYPCPYLQDQDQTVAKAFAAGKNPVAYVVVPDSAGTYKVVYFGKIDDNPLMADAAKEFYVKDVLDKILSGILPESSSAAETGCHIKGL